MRLLVALLVLCVSCGTPKPPAPPPPPRQVDGWQREIAPFEATDENPDAHIVEVSLEAAVNVFDRGGGKLTPAWSYNGHTPGPLIRANVGDEIRVHVKNSLPEATSVHWHGVRVPNAMDGAPPHTQAPIAPGATFTYSFIATDPGLFWYHPHSDSAAQVGYGLYGALLVAPAEEPANAGDETVLVLSDMFLSNDGGLGDPRSGDNIGDLFGREGEVLLVNGRERPTVKARLGLHQRFRIVNAAKTRFFQLEMPGHEFIRIGGDGGLRPTPLRTSSLLLTPGERADVVVVPHGTPGQKIPVKWVAFDRGYGTTFNRPPLDIFYVELVASDGREDGALPTALRTIEAISAAGASSRNVELTQATVGTQAQLGINGVPFAMATPLQAHVNTTEKWTVSNKTDWDHPFHLHGFFFQVLDDPRFPDNEWKDTFNVPAQKSRTFLVRFDDRTGMWMFHCHILDHAELGMMGMVELMP